MPLQVNISNIAYIAFRLSPFIIVCFFTLESFLNWNLKGIVYLVGLLFACTLNVLCSNIFTSNRKVDSDESISDTNNTCVSLSLGEGNKPLSKLPLSTAVFSFTFFYLFTFIINLSIPSGNFINSGKNNSSNKTSLSNALFANLPTMILFPLLVIIDICWNMLYGCSTITSLAISIIISGFIGIIWASIIASSKNPDLIYISDSIGNVCSKPTATMFRCRTKNASSDSKIASIPKINSAADIVKVTEGQLTLPTLSANPTIPTGQ